MAYAELSDGKKIYYQSFGPEGGRPVLLVHGWCATSSLWSKQTGPLADAGYRVVALDSAGHGRSSKKSNEVTMRSVVKSLNELCSFLGWDNKKIALCGHSAGGGAAMAMYFSFPHRIECLCLLNTGYEMRDSLFRKILWTSSPPFVEMAFHPAAKIITRPFINVFAEAVAHKYGADPHEARRWFSDVHRTRGRIARLEIEEIMRHNIKPRLKEITVPTLVIGGDHDFLAPGRMSKIMGELIPNAETHILPINHVGKMFNPGLVNPLLLGFLKRHYSTE